MADPLPLSIFHELLRFISCDGRRAYRSTSYSTVSCTRTTTSSSRTSRTFLPSSGTRSLTFAQDIKHRAGPGVVLLDASDHALERLLRT